MSAVSTSSQARAAGWFASAPPSVALEIGARRVTAVALSGGRGTATLSGHGTEVLPDGLVSPSLTTPNITDHGAVAAAVRRTLDAVGTRTRRVALVLPDGAAKVSLVRFEKLPASAQDLNQLVRWQVKKAVPFPLEQAQVAWTRGAVEADGTSELVVAIARQDIVAEYEAVCSAAGVHAGVVDLATFNLINVVLASDRTRPADGPAGDWLLVHVAPDSSTLAILRGSDLILFRNLQTNEDASLADLVHQSAMYYEDRLGGQGLSRVIVVPRDLTPEAFDEVETVCRAREKRSGLRVSEIDVRPVASFSDGITPGHELLRAVAAPVGILLRGHAA